MAFPGQALTVQIVERQSDEGRVQTFLNLANESDQTLDDQWRIYFSLGLKPVESETRVSQTLIDGRYGYLAPTGDWRPLAPGDSTRIEIENWLLTHMELVGRQGLHFTSWGSTSNEARPVIPATKPPDLLPGDQLANEWIRNTSPSCDVEPDTAGHRYETNLRAAGSAPLAVIPQPVSYTQHGAPFTIHGLSFEDDELDKVLNSIRTTEGLPVLLLDHPGGGNGYEITVAEDQIRLSAGTACARFHAAQTLRQLTDGHRITPCTVKDEPDFGHRGLFIDIARHFHNASALKKVIRAMSTYKMNRLQLGISNDEGWRLEIEGLPELTQIGARRAFDAIDDSGDIGGLYPAWGDGPEENVGFLSRDEFIDLLRFADSHHVVVIPEFNLPAHANALIRAMKASGRYKIVDSEDESRHRSAQGFCNNVVNVCLEDSYSLATEIINAIADCYADAGLDLKFLHLGGDEVPPGSWLHSKAVRQSPIWNPSWDPGNEADASAATKALLSYYADRMTEIARQVNKNIQLGFWHEMSPMFSATSNIYITGWTTEALDRNLIEDVLDRGQKLVIANASFLYLDMPHSLHKDEPGLPWAAYIDSERIHQFEPLDCWGIETTVLVQGLQAQLWTETVDGEDALHYYLFPRLLAVADRAWRKLPGSWPAFASALGERELAYLDELGIRYRVPPPGAQVADGQLLANCNLPGLTIRYTTDGKDPTPESPGLGTPLDLDQLTEIRLAVFSANNERSGRIEVIDNLLDANLY